MKILTFILSAIFTLSGGAKLLGLEFELEAFERWGYPLEFMYFTGVCEVAGGLALALNILRKYAILGLSLLMIGATATHAINNEWPMFIIALIIFGLSVFVTISNWRIKTTSVSQHHNEEVDD